MPGRADTSDHPLAQRVASACEALARLHLLWERLHSRRGHCNCRRAPARSAEAMAIGSAGAARARRPWLAGARVLERWIPRIPAELFLRQREEQTLQPACATSGAIMSCRGRTRSAASSTTARVRSITWLSISPVCSAAWSKMMRHPGRSACLLSPGAGRWEGNR